MLKAHEVGSDGVGATTQWQGVSPAPLRPWAQYPEAREQNKQNTRISIWKFLSTKVKFTVCAPRLEITLYPKREKSTAWEGGTSQDRLSSDPAEGEQTTVQPFLSFSFVLIFKVNMTIMVSSWCPYIDAVTLCPHSSQFPPLPRLQLFSLLSCYMLSFPLFSTCPLRTSFLVL